MAAVFRVICSGLYVKAARDVLDDCCRVSYFKKPLPYSDAELHQSAARHSELCFRIAEVMNK